MADKTVVEDLAVWLTAIWDEEARLAKAADWGIRSGSRLWVQTISSPGIAPAVCASPQHVLARIAADRKILEDLAMYCFETPGQPCGACDRVGCRNLRRMASPYADRPGFRPEWLVERQGVEQ